MFRIIVAAGILAASLQPASAELMSRSQDDRSALERLLSGDAYHVAARSGCKSVSTCEEAVQMWCDGYSRADADHDGIPCENVCSSKAQVDEIKKRIGC